MCSSDLEISQLQPMMGEGTDAELMEEIQSLRKELAAVNAQRDQLLEDKEGLMKEMEAFKEDFTMLRAEVGKLKGRSSEMRCDEQSSEEQAAFLEKHLRDALDTIRQVTEQRDSLAGDLKDVINLAKEERDAYQKIVGQLQDQLQQAEQRPASDGEAGDIPPLEGANSPQPGDEKGTKELQATLAKVTQERNLLFTNQEKMRELLTLSASSVEEVQKEMTMMKQQYDLLMQQNENLELKNQLLEELLSKVAAIQDLTQEIGMFEQEGSAADGETSDAANETHVPEN